jgi:hypothetical protein
MDMKGPVTLSDADVRSVTVVEVIKVEFARGAGVPGDPVRIVVQYWDKEGNMIVEQDAVKDDKLLQAEQP